ncbi:MAG TPA: glycosyltransferase family 2 protein [Elusimicrobia bacterium]|nr:glycosyltransferase family 2 protein [Elusimicrobiota bacterium]
MTDLSISIVSYNVKERLRACLDSVYSDTTGLACEIFVVDNNSGDGTAAMLEKDFPRVTLIRNETNQGYAKANNAAISRSAGAFVLVLNPDTIVLPGALAALVGSMRKDPGIGVCGPKIYNPDMTLQGSGERYPTFLYSLLRLLYVHALFPRNPVRSRILYSGWDRATRRDVDALNGACLMVRKEAIARAGQLDGNFRLYFEEVDWCRRIRSAGWRVCFLPEAEIIHYGGQSSGQMARERIDGIFNESCLYYHRKYSGYAAYLALKITLNCFTLPAAKVRRWAACGLKTGRK